MKLHRKKIMIIAAAAAMAACPLNAMAAGDSLSDQLNRTNSFYSGMRGITAAASPNTNSSNTNNSNTNYSNTSNSSTGAVSGPGSTTTSGTGNTSSSSRNGVIIENKNSTSANDQSSSTTAGTLPSKKVVALSEQYYEDYGMYEEGIDGEFYFYSNIGNGQITDQSVYVDFPANLTYTAELDGQTFTYYSKQPLTTKGTYVFRITAICKTGESLSQQTEYQTTFRFRIQDKPAQKKTEETKSAAENSDSSYVWNSTNSSSTVPLIDKAADVAEALAGKSLPIDYIRKSIKEGSITLEQMANMLGVTSSALQEYLDLTATQEESTSASESQSASEDSDSALFGEDSGETSEEASNEASNETSADPMAARQPENLEEAAKIAEAAAGRGTGSGLVESIDSLTGEYLETLLTGTSFGVSVQNGATVNGSVSFRFPTDNTLAVQVTRNGEPYEYTVGSDFTESGWYCMDLQDTVAGYDETYKNKETPKFYFQIINDPVNNLQLLFVPQGEAVKSFTRNGEEQSDHGSWVSLPFNGTYELTYTTASGKDETVTIEKDSRPPKLQLTVKHSSAIVTTDNAEDQIIVFKDGEQTLGPVEGVITGAGTYQVFAVDTAGNRTPVHTFKLGHAVTAASVIAVLLLMILGSGGIGYVIWIKRNTSMREK